MPTKTAKSKTSGKGLKKKLGPFPTYYWLIGGVVIVVGYLYYRKRHSGTGSTSNPYTSSLDAQSVPSGIIAPISGNGAISNPVGDSTGDSTGDSVTFPTDYATQTDLNNAVASIGDSTKASIAAITFPPPTVNITVPRDTVASTTTKSKTAAKKAVPSTPTKYFTKKTQVKLKAGQTLHFTPKKGYYAA